MSKHSNDLVFRAEELYCVDGISPNDIAAQLGVSRRAVFSWARKNGWGAKREEILQAKLNIRINTILLRAKMLEKAMESLDPKDALAVVALEKMAAKDEREPAETRPVPEKRLKPRSDKERVETLKEIIELKIDHILDDPVSMQLSDFREVVKYMELVDEMESDLRRSERSAFFGGAYAAVFNDMRRKLLGWNTEEIPADPNPKPPATGKLTRRCRYEEEQSCLDVAQVSAG